MLMSGIIMVVAVLVKCSGMDMEVRMFLINEQECATEHQKPSEDIRNRRQFTKNDDG